LRLSLPHACDDVYDVSIIVDILYFIRSVFAFYLYSMSVHVFFEAT